MTTRARVAAKTLAIFTSVATAAVVLTACGPGTTNDGAAENAPPPTTTTAPATPSPAEEIDVVEPTPEKPAAENAAPAETVAQENARRSAESYLEYSGFSRSGLIDQLKYDGYSAQDATYAVDAISPNWNEQAVRVAESYLDYSGFSRSGLIDQLKYEGFTRAQAEHAANSVGL